MATETCLLLPFWQFMSSWASEQPDRISLRRLSSLRSYAALVQEAAMNVAGALARSMRNDGTPDLDLVVRMLVETASTQPALAIAGESENDGEETNFLTVTGGISAERVASRLVESRFAELVQPVALGDFISSGRAGIPWLTKD